MTFYAPREMRAEPVPVNDAFTVTTPFGEGFVQDIRDPNSADLARMIFRKPVINGKQYSDVEMYLSRRDYPLADVPSVTLWHTDDGALTDAARFKLHKWLDENTEIFNALRAPLPAADAEAMRRSRAKNKVLASIVKLTDYGLTQDDLDRALEDALKSSKSGVSYTDQWLYN